MAWNPTQYRLPLPPNQRQLSAVRNSPVRALLARYRSASGTVIRPPRIQPPASRQFVPGKKFTPISPDLKKTKTVRDALGLISACARQGKMVRIIYRKMKDGSIVQRTVEPYSLRYRQTRRGGRARYFYGYDSGEGNPTKGIHSFRMSNIMGVEQTDRSFTPRWKVEF
jgi:predicted DNA-binding transcriptional regulator YafY